MGGLLPIECSWEHIHTFIIMAVCHDHKLKLQPSCFLTLFKIPHSSAELPWPRLDPRCPEAKSWSPLHHPGPGPRCSARRFWKAPPPMLTPSPYFLARRYPPVHAPIDHLSEPQSRSKCPTEKTFYKLETLVLVLLKIFKLSPVVKQSLATKLSSHKVVILWGKWDNKSEWALYQEKEKKIGCNRQWLSPLPRLTSRNTFSNR